MYKSKYDQLFDLSTSNALAKLKLNQLGVSEQLLRSIENDTLKQARKLANFGVADSLLRNDALTNAKKLSNLGITADSLLQRSALVNTNKLANIGVANSILRTVENDALAQAKKALSIGHVSSISEQMARLNIDKNLFIGNSAIRRAEESYKSQLALISGSSISALLEKYSVGNNFYNNSIASQIIALKSEDLLHLEYPEADEIDLIINDDSELELDEEEKTSLITVNHLPLRVLSKILSNPDEVRNITPRQFEEFIADLLFELGGFQDIKLTPRSRDGGKDVIATKLVHGIPFAVYFECKQYAEGNKIQLDTMRSLLGTMAYESRNVNKGVLVTTSTFTKGCKDLILSDARLDGKDYDDILGWIGNIKK